MSNNTLDLINKAFLEYRLPVLVQLHPYRYALRDYSEFKEEEDWSFVDTIEFKVPSKNRVNENKELVEKIISAFYGDGGWFTELEDRENELVFHVWREDKLTMYTLESFHYLSEKYTDRLEPLLKEYGVKGCSLLMKIVSIMYC